MRVTELPPTFTSVGDAALDVVAQLAAEHGKSRSDQGKIRDTAVHDFDADPPGPDPRALDAYHEFLFQELRYLGAERGIRHGAPCNTAAQTFHDDARQPGHTPSTRAERVLAALGIDWTRDQREPGEIWPLPSMSSVEAA